MSSSSPASPLDLALKPIGAVLYALLRLISGLVPVAVGLLRYDRIGHLTSNTDLYLRRRAAGKIPKKQRLVLFSGKPANDQLLRMIRRRVTVLTGRAALAFYRRGLLPYIESTPLHEPLPYRSNEYEDFAAAEAPLRFTKREEYEGRRLLAKIGVGESSPFVCFHARDKAYMPTVAQGDWSYQDFRDCSIDNYIPAAEMLAERGVYALRMGSVVEKPIRAQHPHVIDYAARFRSDFGDVYLPARCKFFLGSEAGLINVPSLFDVPVAAANLTPIGFALTRRRDLYILKKYRDARGRWMPLRELIKLGADRWLHSEKFKAAGIELVENTPEEIADLAEEMNARLDGVWKTEPVDEELQRRFRALFPPEHPISGFPSRLGARFLRSIEALLK